MFTKHVMCCSPFYSDNLDKKKVRGKIVKNVIIVMGKYQEDHGGTKVLFHLAKRLNEAGCDTKIWPSKMPVSKFNLQYLFWIFRKLISFRLGEVIEEHTWPKYPIKYDLKVAKPADISGAVVIYTETINGNPLGADKVVRWILNYPGHGRNKRPRYDRAKEKFPTLKGFSGDGGYQGTSVNHVEKEMKLHIEISKKIKDKWAVLPKRWIVERTFSWINNCRRMAKDFEILTCSAENFIRIAMIQIMLDKLC